MKPSDIRFIDPMGSVFRQSEHETIGRNIAQILSDNGNEFRLLPFAEYEQRRKRDRATDRDLAIEKPFFDAVVRHLETEQTARLFSPCWDLA